MSVDSWLRVPAACCSYARAVGDLDSAERPVIAWRSAAGPLGVILSGFRFHDQRHAHRTWLTEVGIADPLAHARLGHKMPGVEVTAGMQSALMSALQKLDAATANRTG